MGSFSIFDPSSHKSKKAVKQTPKIPSKPPPKVEVSEKDRELLFQNNPQLREWIEKIESLHKDIVEKTQWLIEKKGHTPRSIKRYLEDPKNFTPKQWEMIQEQKQNLESKLGLLIDPGLKHLKKTKENKTLSKERKGKTLGSRKQWLDMR